MALHQKFSQAPGIVDGALMLAANAAKPLRACVVITLLLSACSPYLYNDEVSNISSAIGSINAGWKNGQQAIIDDHSATVIEYAAWRGSAVDLKGPCGRVPDNLPSDADVQRQVSHLQLSNGPCEIGVPALSPAAPVAVPGTLENINKTMSAMSAYATALLAITNSADNDSLNKASANFVSAVGKAADVAGSLGASKTDVAAAKAATTLGTDIAAAILNTERYRVLKKYVLVMDPLMPTLGGELGDALGQVQARRIESLEMHIALNVIQFDAIARKRAGAEDQALLTTVQGHMASYDQLISSKPKEVANELVKTHHALADALREDRGQTAAVIDSAQTLANDADKLRQALSPQAAAKGSGG
jgi:hypothetical protein